MFEEGPNESSCYVRYDWKNMVGPPALLQRGPPATPICRPPKRGPTTPPASRNERPHQTPQRPTKLPTCRSVAESGTHRMIFELQKCFVFHEVRLRQKQ